MSCDEKIFEELCLNRKNWVESSKVNGFYAGILKLLTEMYPDKAHFVYELLQNAEDAKATSVNFILHEDCLEFIHNGSRLFNIKDIDAITNIANTTKNKNEDHSIGKFGVGFKAVFEYTSNPRIYSGEWNFEINDLVVPTKIHPLPNQDNNKTYFILPFNNGKMKSYEEIKIGLSKLPLETLLFLNNIKELNWECGEEKHKIYKEEKNHNISLYVDAEIRPRSQYLKFSKNNIKLKKSDGNMIDISVALAYKLSSNIVVPIESHEKNVFIYFPAEKENSKLRFLINAPFDSDVSRASTRDTEDNLKLIHEIAELQAETMQFLKCNGYLTTEFLGILPNSKDCLSDMYSVFHSRILETFKNEDYTPTMSGNFLPAKKLYKGGQMYPNGPHMSEFISNNDLALMMMLEDETDKKIDLWVQNARQNNSSADFFLQDLNIPVFKNDELIKWLQSAENNTNKFSIWENLINKKTPENLAKMYLMFSENKVSYKIKYEINKIPLFRCMDGKMYSFDDRIYTLQDYDNLNNISNNHHIIDNKTFGSKRQKEKIKDYFYEYLNIEDFSQKSLCKEMLEKYKVKDNTTDEISLDEHMQDIKLLIQTYKENNIEIKRELENKRFVLNSENEYCEASNMYLDDRYGNISPNISKMMNDVSSILKLSKISIEYKNYLKSDEIKVFVEILTELKAKKQLWMVKSMCEKNPNYYEKLCSYRNKSYTGIDEDYDIYKLEDIIERVDLLPKVSRLIWISILQKIFTPNTTTAIYKANQQDIRHTCPSKYVSILAKNKWILNKNGILCKPEDISFENLPDNWNRPEEGYNHPILKAIKFGLHNQKLKEIKLEEDNIAHQAGFKNHEAAVKAKQLYEIAEQSGKSEEEIKEFLQPRKNCNHLPESSSNNLERRQSKISDNYNEAENQTYEIRERSIRVSNKNKSDITEYLEKEYTNDDGEMYCQLCGKIMPFKKKNGKYYFEATQIFTKMDKENKNQYLALCPNCAAEYDEWVRKDENKSKELKDIIKARNYQEQETHVEINFYMNNTAKFLRFTGKHYLDLSTILGINRTNLENEKSENKFNKICDISNTKKGDTVYSETFGEGVVEDILGEKIVQVKFSSTIKKMSIEYLKKK